jgi:uncharacterized protein
MTTVLWQAADGGSEICRLQRAARGWRLSGTVLTHEAQQPVEIRYAVMVDATWATTEVSARVRIAEGEPRELPDLGAIWSSTSRPAPYESCVDVDLSFTPATNTLPIRRLGLDIGDSADIEVAWLTWPELEVRPARQTYTRLAKDRYLYAQADFTAEVVVDQQGLVVDYEGLWRSVART